MKTLNFMKSMIFILLALFSINGYSQSATMTDEEFNEFLSNMDKGTTLEEYRYCSKGFKNQLENGLDPQKKGYLIQQIGKVQGYEYTQSFFGTKYTVKFFGFFKEKNMNLQGTIMVINENSFYCIPNQFTNDEQVLKEYKAIVNNLESTYMIVYSLSLGELSSMYIDESFKPE